MPLATSLSCVLADYGVGVAFALVGLCTFVSSTAAAAAVSFTGVASALAAVAAAASRCDRVVRNASKKDLPDGAGAVLMTCARITAPELVPLELSLFMLVLLFALVLVVEPPPAAAAAPVDVVV